MKKLSIVFAVVSLFALTCPTASLAQGLLNKVKSKANQELNKLENGATSKPATTPNKNVLSANVTRTVLFALAANESFDYQESCIDLSTSLTQASFILHKSGSCISYKNGTRTPVPCPAPNSGCGSPEQCSFTKLIEVDQSSDEIKKYITDKTSTNQVNVGMTDEQLKQMSAYMTAEQIEEVKKAMKQASQQSYSLVESRTITFNGKKYGPYKMINPFFLTADKKHFYAVISESNDKPNYKVITSASTASITTENMVPPLSVFAAPDHSQFAITMMGSDGSSYSVVTSAAKVYKVKEPGWLHGAWYSGSGNHIVIYEHETVSVDGNVIKTFPANSSIEACDLFVGSDGKGIAQVKDNAITFPDGDYFQYPLRMAVINSNGKSMFKWLALEDRQLVVYEKPF
jgi:hypothetical protein